MRLRVDSEFLSMCATLFAARTTLAMDTHVSRNNVDSIKGRVQCTQIVNSATELAMGAYLVVARERLEQDRARSLPTSSEREPRSIASVLCAIEGRVRKMRKIQWTVSTLLLQYSGMDLSQRSQSRLSYDAR